MSLSYTNGNRFFSIPNVKSSFEPLDQEELVTHIAISKYGSFQLTDAVRPSYDLRIVPEEGYCHRVWRNRTGNRAVSFLAGSVSREKLLSLFFDLLNPLGPMVDAVLESSHFRRTGHTDYQREGIDLSVLKSILCDYEDLLLNDGYLGIAVLNPQIPVEVKFDEHKTLAVFGKGIAGFEQIFRRYGVEQNESLRFLAEDEHLHASDPAFRRRFESLCAALGTEFNFTA